MKRYRTCTPAVGGGEHCPDKRKEIDLFQEEEHCAATDCDSKDGFRGFSGFYFSLQHFMKLPGHNGHKYRYHVA